MDNHHQVGRVFTYIDTLPGDLFWQQRLSNGNTVLHQNLCRIQISTRLKGDI